jgi:hypothetical protein
MRTWELVAGGECGQSLGVVDMRRLYESITDLPIDFVLTHTYWDHLGAAYQWEKIGVNSKGKDL